jgi:hypothetical protein
VALRSKEIEELLAYLDGCEHKFFFVALLRFTSYFPVKIQMVTFDSSDFFGLQR